MSRHFPKGAASFTFQRVGFAKVHTVNLDGFAVLRGLTQVTLAALTLLIYSGRACATYVHYHR
jgi:hypothetical protein